MYMVIELHPCAEDATFCVDEDGNNLVFEYRKDAQKRADFCQEGLVIEI